MFRLDNKVALVTGAGSGIGRATALALAREGARVVVADLVEEGGQETVGLVQKAGGEASFVKVDVAQAAEVEALVKKSVEVFGRIDCAFNNAGIEGAIAPIARYGEEDFDRVIAINLKGVFLCLKYEIAQLLEQGGGGAIVNTASAAGLIGAPTMPAYVASKHGVIGLTKSAALAYARRGIRVNAVCPGVIRTPMVERVISEFPQAETNFLVEQPIQRFGMPEEIAEAVVWLCSDAASLVTGVPVPVDGGYVAH